MRELRQSSLIEGNREALTQWLALLAQLSESQYCSAPQPVQFGIGRHARHVLDMYRALRKGLAEGEVDYELRHRDSRIEHSPLEAMTRLHNVLAWLPDIGEDRPLRVHTRVSAAVGNIELLDSCLSRELAFVASHSVHHLAYAVVLAKLQGCEVDESLGLAPATVHAEPMLGRGAQ